jgi:very-short-patch-repair endonuclease
MTQKPLVMNCKTCGTLLRCSEDSFEQELYGLLSDDYAFNNCATCRFHNGLNRKLAIREQKIDPPDISPPAEKLWLAIMDEFNGEGLHFYNEVPAHLSYRLDFYCPEVRLAIEVDGKEFHKDSQRDRRRDDEHSDWGIKTIRLKASDVNNDMLNVLSRVRSEVGQRGRHAFEAKGTPHVENDIDRLFL